MATEKDGNQVSTWTDEQPERIVARDCETTLS
jgi:hypothetical protein